MGMAPCPERGKVQFHHSGAERGGTDTEVVVLEVWLCVWPVLRCVPTYSRTRTGPDRQCLGLWRTLLSSVS